MKRRRDYHLPEKGANKIFTYNNERYITAAILPNNVMACLRINSKNLPYGKVEKIPRTEIG